MEQRGGGSVENYPKTTTNFSFLFCDYNVICFGTCNTLLERCFQDLFNGILQAPEFQKIQLVKPKKICSFLATAEQTGQKNCNGKTTMFSTSALKESWASAYYWQCLLMRIGWSILWSSISKRSLPKLWILMTLSKNLWGATWHANLKTSLVIKHDTPIWVPH